MKKLTLLLLFIMTMISCTNKTSEKSNADLKKEIIKTEKEFEAYCKKNGIANGFYAFADSSAVIKLKNDTLLKGKENIKNHFEKSVANNTSVTWNADFVSVSDDGTLAYTYGKYLWTTKDSLGVEKKFNGIFHTVWKKQKDGSWKYVWD